MPQIRKSGSTGVKADIDIATAPYRAASNLVGQFGQYNQEFRERAQRLNDNAKKADYSAESIEFQSALDQPDSAFNQIDDPQERAKLFNEELAARDERVKELAGKMSKEEAASLTNAYKTDRAKLVAKYSGKIATDAIDSANTSIFTSAIKTAQNGGLDEALEGIDMMEVPEAEKIKSSEKVISAYNSGLKARYTALAESNPNSEVVNSIYEQIDSESTLTDVEKKDIKDSVNEAYQGHHSGVISGRIETHQVSNDIESIEAEQKEAESKSGDYANLDETRLAAKKNELEAARQTVFNRQARTFDSIMTSLSRTGTYNELEYQEAVRNGSLTEQAQAAIKQLAPNSRAKTAAFDRFKEDERGTTYKLLRKDIDEKWIEKYAGGTNTVMDEKDFTKFEKRIMDNPDIGQVAKNKLLSRLMIASSQAVLEDDDEWFDDGVFDAVEGLEPDQRKLVSDFQKEAARYVSNMLSGDLLLTRDIDGVRQAAPVSITDVFLADLEELATGIKAGKNMQSQLENRLRFYRVGSQRAAIRKKLQEDIVSE
jgi:hypothetical protein